MALLPYIADPPPRITSTRSIIFAGINSSPYTPANPLKTGRELISICEYGPSSPFILTCEKPQFWQLFSMRSPGAKLSPSLSVTFWVRSNNFGFMLFTMVGDSLLLFSFRSAETTTCSRPITSGSSWTRIVTLFLASSFISFSTVLYPMAEITAI